MDKARRSVDDEGRDLKSTILFVEAAIDSTRERVPRTQLEVFDVHSSKNINY